MNAKMGKSRPSIQMSENAGYPSIQNKGEVNVHANAHVQTLQAHARTISVDDNMIRLHNERVRNGDTDDGYHTELTLRRGMPQGFQGRITNGLDNNLRNSFDIQQRMNYEGEAENNRTGQQAGAHKPWTRVSSAHHNRDFERARERQRTRDAHPMSDVPAGAHTQHTGSAKLFHPPFPFERVRAETQSADRVRDSGSDSRQGVFAEYAGVMGGGGVAIERGSVREGAGLSLAFSRSAGSLQQPVLETPSHSSGGMNAPTGRDKITVNNMNNIGSGSYQVGVDKRESHSISGMPYSSTGRLAAPTPRKQAQLDTAKKLKLMRESLDMERTRLEAISYKGYEERAHVYHEAVTPRKPRSTRKVKQRHARTTMPGYQPSSSMQALSETLTPEDKPFVSTFAPAPAPAPNTWWSVVKRVLWAVVYVVYGTGTVYALCYLAVYAIMYYSRLPGGPPS